MRLNLLSVFIGILCLTNPLFGQSVLSAGEWYKFAVEQEGIYKLSYADLQNAGISISTVDPKNISIYGNRGGMLPQLNSVARPYDLEENAIKVVGGEDGVFNSQDYILFYAQGPDAYFYDQATEIYQHERNIYSRKNFYYLTITGQDGKRISFLPDLGTSNHAISTYTRIDYFEKDELNVWSSGREWFGRLSNEEKLFDLPYKELAPDGSLKIFAEVMGQSTTATAFTLNLNNQLLGEIPVGSIRDYNKEGDFYQYSDRGIIASSVFTIDNSNISTTGSNLQLNLKFLKTSSSISRGYYNKVLAQAELPLEYDQDFIFSSIKSLEHGIVTYKITNSTGNLMLWNVTPHGNAREQGFSKLNDEIQFGAFSSTLEKYALFNPASVESPEFVGIVDNQNLKGSSTPDLVVITHPDFHSEAKRLATFRNEHNGYDVLTATTEQIYNEFSGGRADVTAIRDFIKYLYDKSPDKLQYVLILGKGSYDYLDLANADKNSNYVPIYQSRNSLHPLKTYGSDDYFGFLEDNEGEWIEDYQTAHTLEVAIGRLPVTSNAEARQVIDKLIHYSSSASTYGDWRSKILFVADDGDRNLHVDQADDLAAYVGNSLEKVQEKKLYLDNYKQEMATAADQKSPEARKSLYRQIEDGVLIVNFTGHGGEKKWMDEDILDLELIESFKNYNKLPLFITATCAFGRHDNPAEKSGGERLVLHPAGGGIGLVTTSRPVYAFSNFTLNKAFYEAYTKFKDGTFTIGDIFKETKNNSVLGTNNRNFSLLGDPSLILNSPSLKVTVENIAALDTIKSLQEVLIRGYIEDEQGNVMNDFNGEVKITLADKPVLKTTKGDPYESNEPYRYEESSSIIFRGNASVNSGYFEFRFTVPVDIDHAVGDGDMHLYAYDQDQHLDAAYSYKVMVGGTAEADFNDLEAPEINVYLGDTTFKNGDVVGSDALLLVYLSDESGINISGRSFNSDIMATLNEQEFVLNDYFTSSKDDYKSGWVVYPLEDLDRGEYTITLSGSDIYNNTTTITVDFKVIDADQFEIVELASAPNPASDFTSFYFTHNRAGEALEGELNIFNSQGANILKVDFETEMGQVRHKIFDWDCRTANGEKLEQGIYYFHINVRSKLDGSGAGKFQKIILLN
ncbi:MAG: type IX secretion system sortase PorU [Candidatus Cyclobacteriaceae bacterium M2_1C_046]